VTSWGNVAAVVAAVLEDAAVEIERLEREADDAIAALAARPPPIEPPECEAARARVEREIAAAEQEEEATEFAALLEQRERWIARVLESARARLGSGAASGAERDRLADLACDGARHLPGSSCIVQVVPSTQSLLDADWIAKVAGRAGKTITIESAGVDGGCVVVSDDRRWSFDNTYRARSRRAEPTWRAALCRIYDDTVRQSATSGQAVCMELVRST
jgi:vacuolar-type H+-ATPase subunit E/Vma4